MGRGQGPRGQISESVQVIRQNQWGELLSETRGSCWALQRLEGRSDRQPGVQLELPNKARNLGPRGHPSSQKDPYKPLPLLAIVLASEVKVQGLNEMVSTIRFFWAPLGLGHTVAGSSRLVRSGDHLPLLPE